MIFALLTEILDFLGKPSRKNQVIYFELLGQLPSGKNGIGITRTGHRFPKKRFVRWREDAMGQLRDQSVIPEFPLAIPMAMQVRYWAKDRHRRDVPGMEDALYHLLERAGVIADDVYICDPHWSSEGLDRKNPRAVVELIPLEDWPDHLPQPRQSARDRSPAEDRRQTRTSRSPDQPKDSPKPSRQLKAGLIRAIRNQAAKHSPDEA